MSRWLSVEEVLLLHDLALELDGGEPGLLNRGLLESALAQAQAGFGTTLFHPTPLDQAAAYLFHLSQAHAFNDGNKRAAVLAALTFMQLNGLTLSITPEALFELALDVAKGQASKADIAKRLAP